MSRIGKKAVAVPNGVTVTLDGQTVSVKGPKGQLAWTVADEIEVRQEGGELLLSKRQDTTRAQAMWGLSRTLINNMVVGVTQGYEETLELVGVGYRAQMKGSALSMQLGFSHDVDIQPPAGVAFAVPKQTEIKISGIDKQVVGEIAARIRRIRPPEPYMARACAMPARRSAARKARRSKPWRSLLVTPPSVALSASALAFARCPLAVRACRSSVRRRTSTPRSSTMRTA